MFVKYLKIKAYKNGFVIDDGEGDGPIVTISQEIFNYLGQWVNPFTVKPDMGECIFRLELCKLDVDYEKKELKSKGELYAKLLFCNFQKQPYNKDDIIVLRLNDPDNYHLEIIGDDADAASMQLSMQPIMKNGVKYLNLQAKNGINKLLKDCRPHYIDTTTENILQWYSYAILDQERLAFTNEQIAAEKMTKKSK